MHVLDMPSEQSECLSQSCSSEAPPAPPVPNEALGRRLARAKARLDRIRLDSSSRDQAELDAARVEFALASQALADDLIAQGLGTGENDD